MMDARKTGKARIRLFYGICQAELAKRKLAIRGLIAVYRFFFTRKQHLLAENEKLPGFL